MLRLLRVVGLAALVGLVAGCGSTGETIRKGAFCAVGAAGGYFAGQYLADKFLDKIDPKYGDTEALKTAFVVGTSLALCGAVVYAGESIYKNLSEKGIKNREDAIAAALDSTESRTYEDPENPGYKGTVQVTQVSGDVGEDCRLVEDTLASAESSETVFTEYCNTGDGWKPQLIG